MSFHANPFAISHTAVYNKNQFHLKGEGKQNYADLYL